MRTLILATICALALTARDKRILTIAGDGTPGQIDNPFGVVIGPDGALYFCEYGGQKIRRLDLKTKALSIVAGTGRKGYSGDGGPALQATFNLPHELRFDKSGNMYIADMENAAIRRIDAKTHVITTIAGTGKPGFSGDGGPAAQAQLRQPHSIQFDHDGRLLICDVGNHRIRAVDLKTGVINTWAGTGERKPTPDGAPRLGTPLNGPRSIDADPAGNLYVALREGNAVYRIDRQTDHITHLAGTGEKGYSGDGGPARGAKLSGPKGITWSPDGSVYIADTESHTIRRIDLKTGLIRTVAGTGEKGDGPDGDPLKCKLGRPHGVFVDRKGVLYIGDSEAHRVRILK